MHTGRPLGQFIRHYEPLSYDAESLMWHHDRVRRSFVGPREISLQLDAFDRFVGSCSLN